MKDIDINVTHVISKQLHEGVRHYCDQCSMKFIRKSNLTEHINAKHNGKGFDCDKCSYKASQLRYLFDHKESKHKDNGQNKETIIRT